MAHPWGDRKELASSRQDHTLHYCRSACWDPLAHNKLLRIGAFRFIVRQLNQLSFSCLTGTMVMAAFLLIWKLFVSARSIHILNIMIRRTSRLRNIITSLLIVWGRAGFLFVWYSVFQKVILIQKSYYSQGSYTCGNY